METLSSLAILKASYPASDIQNIVILIATYPASDIKNDNKSDRRQWS